MKNKLAKISIITTLIACLLVVFFKAYYFTQVGDNLFYAFVLGVKNLGIDAVLGPRVETIGDAIISQYNQYFGWNGRALVLFLAQMFCGPWGYLAFSVFNSLLFVCVMIAFAKYTMNKHIYI
jgi:hypothetical protein